MTDHTNSDEPSSGPRRTARPRWVFPKGTFSEPGLWAGLVPSRDADEALADKPYTVGSSAAVLGAPGHLPALIDGAPSRAANDEQERREADYLSAVFAAADAFGRGREGMSRRANPSRPLPQYALPDTFSMAPNFLVGRHRDTNDAYHVWLHGFDFSHGNGHFFDRHKMAPVRIRPLIHSDRMNPRRASRSSTGWFDEAANALLWLDRGHGVTVFLLHLHSLGDCRDPFTIERAIGCAWGQYGADFPAAVAALP